MLLSTSFNTHLCRTRCLHARRHRLLSMPFAGWTVSITLAVLAIHLQCSPFGWHHRHALQQSIKRPAILQTQSTTHSSSCLTSLVIAATDPPSRSTGRCPNQSQKVTSTERIWPLDRSHAVAVSASAGTICKRHTKMSALSGSVRAVKC